MNRLPKDFFGPSDGEEWKKGTEYESKTSEPKLRHIRPEAETWEHRLARLKDEAFKRFLELNYPDKVFTVDEIKRHAHIEMPAQCMNEELLMFQGRPVLHFKWSNKNKTLEVKELA